MNLSDLEIKVLKVLSKEEKSVEEIAKECNIDYYQAFRTVGFLKLKGLAEIREETVEKIELGDLGKKYLEIGLPETRLLNLLKNVKEISFYDLRKHFSEDELRIAIGILREKGAIEIKDKVRFVKEVETDDYILRKVVEGTTTNDEIKRLINRKDIIVVKKIKKYFVKITDFGEEMKQKIKEEKLITDYTKEVLEKKLWKEYKFKEFEISIPIKPVRIGKKNKYLEFLDEIRNELVSMGFKEMEGYSIIISHFWNFDSLFLPQDHPAGELSLMDTFYIKEPDKIIDFPNELKEKVKETHIKYFNIWDDELASKAILISHVTAISAKTLLNAEIPGKYFLIEKVFRYDTIDAKHFIEFNQLEGIVLDYDLTFRDLLGILKELIVNVIKAEDVKFYPAYFPFTEPSVEVYAKHPKLGWIEVGGAGIFREELLKPFEIEVPVLAWGLGIDRLAMIYLGIDDIRDLHTRDLKKLLE